MRPIPRNSVQGQATVRLEENSLHCGGHTHLQGLGREEGGQLGAQADVLDVQVQHGQQHRHGLLLKPGEVCLGKQKVGHGSE